MVLKGSNIPAKAQLINYTGNGKFTVVLFIDFLECRQIITASKISLNEHKSKKKISKGVVLFS